MPHKPGRDAAKNGDCKCNKLEASLHSPSSSYSIHYTDLHEAWLDGTPMPLLSGPTIETIELLPAD